ncbi:hypothetical protein [Frigoriflavimonas asaccharolytica]|uniref:Chromosome segregation ATPase n=1 Tax=Frigoriflavimonas asaccharolytica TaxID=2735899 RepID=A0A8J8K8E4_9FLAO|nr:hypothetical protein [Frigoriflavimonas asaccharolytica]NRS91862.1 chromosome segregation ATPase [Frigoriflavimonas asaccharolytica]
MLQDLEKNFSELENKIENLNKSYQKLQENYFILEKEHQKAIEKYEGISKENEILTENYKKVKLHSAISGNPEHNRLMKSHINRLVKEVDFCIAQLQNSGL